MKQHYTKKFQEPATIKMLARSERSISSIADELSIPYWTLKDWLKKRAGETTVMNETSLKQRTPGGLEVNVCSYTLRTSNFRTIGLNTMRP